MATVAGGLATVQRAFSVSCTGEAPCVSLTELREGAALPEAIRIRDRHGEIYAEVAGPLRRALPADRIPDLVAEAFVAVEDRRFWSHDGVDARGVARAAVRNLRDGGISEGASTIPMQLVRTLWSESLREVGPWRRKVIEARTAPELIEQLGHDRVLTLYLNAIYLGNGIYGVERASRYYFGVGVEELSTGQIATLVGMTRSPEYYEPRRHSERARGVRAVGQLEEHRDLLPEGAHVHDTGQRVFAPEPHLLEKNLFFGQVVHHPEHLLRAIRRDQQGGRYAQHPLAPVRARDLPSLVE